jgi:hypothetical protein
MKASEFKNGSVKTCKKGSFRIELQRIYTASVKGWYVSIFNTESLILTLNQFHPKFNIASKHYSGLCKNFPVI